MNRVTRCSVRIVTPNTPFGPSTIYTWENDYGTPFGLLDGLQGVTTQGGVNGLRGQFQLHFAPVRHNGLTWAERIPSQSLVSIEIWDSEHPGDDPTVMVGLTKERSHSGVMGKAVQRQVTVEGEGIESVLYDANIWYAPYLDENTAAQNDAIRRAVSGPTQRALNGNTTLQWTAEILGGKDGKAKVYDPREMLLGILRYFIADGSTSVFSLVIPDQPLSTLLVPGEHDEFKPGTPVPRRWTLVDDRIRLAYSQYRPEPGPVAAHVEKIVDRRFHDLFVRYENGRGRIIHRAKPFRTEQPANRVLGELAGGPSLFDLSAVSSLEIKDHDVRQFQLQGGRAAANFIYVLPGFHSADGRQHAKAAFPPQFSTADDFSSVERFGLQPLDTVSIYTMLDRQTNGDETTPEAERKIGSVIALATKLSKLLKVWLDPQPEMWAGTLTVRGRAGYRPGDRVVWTGTEAGPFPLEFHVLGVQHQYNFADGTFLTTLQVERGWRVREPAVGPGPRQVPAGRLPPVP